MILDLRGLGSNGGRAGHQVAAPQHDQVALAVGLVRPDRGDPVDDDLHRPVGT